MIMITATDGKMNGTEVFKMMEDNVLGMNGIAEWDLSRERDFCAAFAMC